MKKEAIILILVSSLLMLIMAGCGSLGLPEKAPETKASDSAAKPAAPAAPAPAAATAEAQAGQEAEVNVTVNETEQPEVELKITGNTRLQTDLSLCPHLQQKFDCDRYDVRGCRFKQRVGDNGFFPDYMICSSGDIKAKGPAAADKPDRRFCFIQECAPIVEGNLAESYGGLVAYAEYNYRKETTDTGIMTYYDLRRCGEMKKEFNTKEECRVYYSEWRGLWD